jgi:hypothetical protein
MSSNTNALRALLNICQLRNPPQFSLVTTLGVTKRCCLSWLTNCALVYEPKCGAIEMHMEPN